MDKRNIEIRIARDRNDLLECFRLRYVVFAQEYGVVHPKKSGLDADKFDKQSVHLLVLEDGRPVGTARLIPAGKRPNFRGLYEINFDLDSDKSFEVSRVAIIREKRGDAKLFYKLMYFIFIYAQSCGYKYFCGTTRPALFRLLKESAKINFTFSGQPFVYGANGEWKMIAFISPVSEENINKFAKQAE
ncbi:GNAT family N-acetyltransferase [Patescibacteria group bacterium]|nr:GNAT family N-acetyltransferase [Patescibacteria group bacterium]